MNQREIKFRAWDLKEQRWLFEYEQMGGFSLVGEIIMLGEWSSLPTDKLEDVAVMQFTGLKDKNGKEIYEGDVVEGGEGRKVIVYSGTLGGFVAKHKASSSHLHVTWFSGYEVIGNIYENPELLHQESPRAA